jgi:DNA-directed RNA polymerase subunit RPC12/RpoP
MKVNNKDGSNDSRRPLSLYAYTQCAGMAGGSPNTGEEPDRNATYVCKNCGRRLTLAEAASFYGIPACPVCVYAGAPFEIVRQPRPSDETTDCRPIEIEP